MLIARCFPGHESSLIQITNITLRSCLSHIGTEAQVLAYSLHQLQVLLGPLLHLTVEVYAPGAFQFQDDLTGNQIQG